MFKKKENKAIYTWEGVIKTADSTPSKELRLSSLARFTQEAAIKSAEELGYDSSKTLNRGLLWVIGKQYFEIYKMPHYGETIKVTTYPGKKIGTFFLRHYKILSSSDEILIRGVAVWCLIDKSTRKTIVPEEHGIFIPVVSEEGELEFPPSYRIENQLLSQTEIEAYWSRCDINGHLNNTYYFDAIEDLIPIDFLMTHTVKSLSITYKKEIRLGDKALINFGYKDPYYDFVGDRFQARIEFK